MDNKIVMISIAAVIGIIVLGSVLMPILDDATATTDKFTNDGKSYIKTTSEGKYTLTWDPTDPNNAVVNGGSFPIWSPGDGVKNISILMIPEVGIMRYNHGAGESDFVSIQAVGFAFSFTQSFTFTYENGAYSIVGATTVTGTSDEVYAIGPNGDFVLKNPTDAAYVNPDSEIIGMGVTTVTFWNNGFQVSGSADDVEVYVYNLGSGTTAIVTSDVDSDYAPVSEYVDLSTIKQVTFTATATPTEGDPVVKDCTYNYFLVPHEVTAERAQHFSDGQIAIFAAIPVMIILAVLLGVVALVIRSRMD